jgi:hypothetical protein
MPDSSTLGMTWTVFGSSKARWDPEGGKQEERGMEKERNGRRKFQSNMWAHHIFLVIC